MKKNPISGLISLFSRYWALSQPDLTKPAPSKLFRLLLEIDLVAIGMITSCYFFYPGCFSRDLQFSWVEAITHHAMQYNLHPPLIAYTFSLLNSLPFSFTPPYANLFFTMNLFYWSGLVLALRPWFHYKPLWIMGFLVIGFFPTSFGILSHPVKDSLMCTALLATYGCFLTVERENSKIAFVFGLFCLFLALGYRHNALFAVIPFAIWAGILSYRNATHCTWWKKSVAGVLIFVMLFSGISVLNAHMTKDNVYPVQQLFSFDLVGISVKTGHVYLPDMYDDNSNPHTYPPMFPVKGADIKGATTTLDNLRQIYLPDSNHNILWEGLGKGLRFLEREEEIIALRQAWLNALIKEPLAYLNVRSDFFIRLMGIVPNDFFPYSCVPQDITIYTTGLIITQPQNFPNFYQDIIGTWWVKGITYVGTIAFLFGIACWKRHLFPLHIRFLGASGLIYAASYFFIGLTSEFRLLYWLIPVSLIMATNILFTIITNKKPKGAK